MYKIYEIIRELNELNSREAKLNYLAEQAKVTGAKAIELNIDDADALDYRHTEDLLADYTLEEAELIELRSAIDMLTDQIKKVEKIYIDRASEYIEITYTDKSKEEFGSDKTEIVFENDERELEVIRAEQKELGREI